MVEMKSSEFYHKEEHLATLIYRSWNHVFEVKEKRRKKNTHGHGMQKVETEAI